jgi:hypothetical protein
MNIAHTFAYCEVDSAAVFSDHHAACLLVKKFLASLHRPHTNAKHPGDGINANAFSKMFND